MHAYTDTTRSCAMVTVMLSIAAAAAAAVEGSQLPTHTAHHFVDDMLLQQRSNGLQVVLGPVTKRGPVLTEAAPWEAGFSNSYPSVFHDDGMYKIWYNSYLGQGRLKSPTGDGLSQKNVHWHWNQTKTQGGAGLKPLAAPATCNSWGGVLQAVSIDGFNFTRPSLSNLLANGSAAPVSTAAPVAIKDTNVAVVSCNAPGRTLYVDPNPAAPKGQRYKMIGCFSNNASADSGFNHGGKDLKAIYSSDGVSFTPAQTLQSAHVPFLMAHDGLANIVFDANVEGQSKYMIFMRTYDLSKTVELQSRRVSRMISKTTDWGGEGSWESPVEVLRGEIGYEIYELRPWRLKSWRPGLYFGIGMYYADAEATGKVYAELLSSHNYGLNWTRLAPHTAFIPHGSGSDFDNFTTYAAAPLLADNGNKFFYYYSGGNGPHNGVRTPDGIRVRDDAIGRADGSAHAIAGLAHPNPAVLSKVLTRPVQIFDEHPSLWITIGRNSATGVRSMIPELTVELQQHGDPVPGFRATNLSSASRCAVDVACRLEIRWNNSLSTIVGQEVEVSIAFRGYTIYSLSQE